MKQLTDKIKNMTDVQVCRLAKMLCPSVQAEWYVLRDSKISWNGLDIVTIDDETNEFQEGCIIQIDFQDESEVEIKGKNRFRLYDKESLNEYKLDPTSCMSYIMSF